MPVAEVKLPNGKVAEVQFPKGATQEQIINFAQKQYTQGIIGKIEDEGEFLPAVPSAGKTPLEATGLPSAVKFINQNKGDIAGGIAGGAGGAALGSSMGPAGTIAGGFVGGIMGATAGKELDEALGTRPEKGIGTNIGISTAEEFGGRAVSALAKPVANFAVNLARFVGNKTGLSSVPKTIEDLFLTEEAVSPLSGGRAIKEAQENLFDERMLSVFEETGGRAGQSMQALLDQAITSSQRESSLASEFLQNRRKIMEKLTGKLGGNTPVQLSDEAFADLIKGSVVDARKILGSQLDEIDPLLVAARPKIKVPIRGVSGLEDIDIRFSEAQKFIKQKLSPQQADNLIGVFNKHFTRTEKDGSVIFKDSVTLEDLAKFENEVRDEVVGKFLPSQNVQKKIAGVYADHVKPIVKDYVSLFRETATDKNTQKVLELQTRFDAIATQKGLLENSTIARKLGLTEAKQQLTAKEASKLENLIFDTPQSWKEITELLDIADPSGEVHAGLINKFKSNIMRDSWDPKAREFTFNKITQQINKYGDDLIKDVGGAEYLKTLQDARLVTLGLDTSKANISAKTALRPDQQIVENLRRVMLHPIAGRVALVQGLQTNLKGLFGFGHVTDEHLFKMMQGERGQLLIEKAMNKPLHDPASYNLYVQVARELTKFGADVTVLNREQYINNVAQGLSDVADGLDSLEE